MHSIAQEYIHQGKFTKAIEVAKKMLTKKLDLSLIQELTGLSKKTLESFLKEVK